MVAMAMLVAAGSAPLRSSSGLRLAVRPALRIRRIEMPMVPSLSKCIRASSMPTGGTRRNLITKTLKKLVKNVVIGLAGAIVCTVIVIATAPAFLSWSRGLNAAVWVANRTIPGNFHVGKAKLGWTEPLVLEDISVKDLEGETVFQIGKVATKASLWSIVTGKAGLGDSAVGPLRINLLPDTETGLPKLALALQPADKLQTGQRRPPKKQQQQLSLPTTTLGLSCDVKAANGGLRIDNGEMLLPADAAAALGNRVHVEVLLGDLASDVQAARTASRLIPIQATMWSECSQARAAGFVNPAIGKVELREPINVEMDLTAELGRIYLSRVNPLLGYIVGPAVTEEDMPDVVLSVSPKDLKLPADHYSLHFEPMKVALARGPLIDGVLGLLSKEDMASRKLIMETSVIEATVDTLSGLLTCCRVDVLIGGKVHVATWGQVDWIEEQVKMTLAVPANTLKDVLALKKLPDTYYLQIPVGGTFDRPQIDLKAAAKGIAQLTLHERAGVFARGLGLLGSDAAPSPVDNLPWTSARQEPEVDVN